MSYGFNKINSKVLGFDCVKDIEKIRFNHYIMRKENLNRLKKEFGKNQFPMTISTVMKDLNLSKSKAERMIKEFENLGIIKSVVKGNLVRGCSVYEYVTMCDNDKDVKNEYEIDKDVSLNVCDAFDMKDDKKDFVKSKKDNINIDLNNNNIYALVVDYLNKKTGKNFKFTTQKTKSCINARLREGFCEADFYKVIDVKVSQWRYSDMSKFLRPETLFSNKFDGYLNEFVSCDSEESTESFWDIEFDF